MALRVMLNGSAREFGELADEASLSAVVAALGLKADRVAIEHNGQIAARRGWDGMRVSSGDKLEIVHFVGGGVGAGDAGAFDTFRSGAISSRL